MKVDGDKKSLPNVVRFENQKIYAVQVGSGAKIRRLIYPDEVFSSVNTLMKDELWREDTSLQAKFNAINSQLTPTEISAIILKKIS